MSLSSLHLQHPGETGDDDDGEDDEDEGDGDQQAHPPLGQGLLFLLLLLLLQFLLVGDLHGGLDGGLQLLVLGVRLAGHVLIGDDELPVGGAVLLLPGQGGDEDGYGLVRALLGLQGAQEGGGGDEPVHPQGAAHVVDRGVAGVIDAHGLGEGVAAGHRLGQLHLVEADGRLLPDDDLQGHRVPIDVAVHVLIGQGHAEPVPPGEDGLVRGEGEAGLRALPLAQEGQEHRGQAVAPIDPLPVGAGQDAHVLRRQVPHVLHLHRQGEALAAGDGVHVDLAAFQDQHGLSHRRGAAAPAPAAAFAAGVLSVGDGDLEGEILLGGVAVLVRIAHVEGQGVGAVVPVFRQVQSQAHQERLPADLVSGAVRGRLGGLVQIELIVAVEEGTGGGDVRGHPHHVAQGVPQQGQHEQGLAAGHGGHIAIGVALLHAGVSIGRVDDQLRVAGPAGPGRSRGRGRGGGGWAGTGGCRRGGFRVSGRRGGRPRIVGGRGRGLRVRGSGGGRLRTVGGGRGRLRLRGRRGRSLRAGGCRRGGLGVIGRRGGGLRGVGPLGRGLRLVFHGGRLAGRARLHRLNGRVGGLCGRFGRLGCGAPRDDHLDAGPGRHEAALHRIPQGPGHGFLAQPLHLLARVQGPDGGRIPDGGEDAHGLGARVLHVLLLLRQSGKGQQGQQHRQRQAQCSFHVQSLSSRIMVMTPASISQTVSQRASIS